MRIDRAVDHVVTTAYNAALVGGCGYVVFGLGYSGWWFAAAALFLFKSSGKD